MASDFDEGGSRDLFGRLARFYDTDSNDPRLNRLVAKVLDKGMDPNQWLDAKIGTRTDKPAAQSVDPRADLSGKRTPTTDDSPSFDVQTKPLSQQEIGLATLRDPDARSRALGNLDRVATQALSYPSMAVDAATLGVYRKARNAATDAIAPAQSAQMQALEHGVESDPSVAGQLAANTARGIGYLSPVGPTAMLGKAAVAATQPLARALPQALARPVAGAATGALIGGGTAAGEAAVEGAPLEDIGRRAATGAGVGAAFGGGIGLAQTAINKSAGAAGRYQDRRLIEDLTESASATKRDRVVGKGGEKLERVVETAKRTPGLADVSRDAGKAGQAIEARTGEIGSRLDEVYEGVGLPVSDVVAPILNRAAALEKNPATRGLAQDLLREAEGVEASWGDDGVVSAKEVRQYATALGKGLFRGNPNTDPGLAKSIKQQVYGDIVGTVSKNVEAVKPGTAEELAALNMEMSDLINMGDAVSARAARDATGPTTLRKVTDKAVDLALLATDPFSFGAKKAIQMVGPSVLRGGARFVANSASPDDSVLTRGAPLLEALRAERQRDQERARMLGGR